MKFQKRPSVIEAMHYDGENWPEISAWSRGVVEHHSFGYLFIPTPGGEMRAEVGDWVACDARGFYPVKDSVFRYNYEPVGEE